MKILVSVFNNLYTDQRVEKFCKTLHENAYQIEVIGNNWGGNPEMQRPYPFSRISLQSKKLRFAYLEFQWKLFLALLKKADQNTILHANDLDALLPNYLVSKIKGIPLVWDSHEIFTEMPTVTNRWVQHVWRLLENALIRKIKYFITANDSYANWFETNYKIKKPIVIRNFPQKSESPKNFVENHPKIILYQGTINYSRGIDKMIEAMQFIENAEFHIAGRGPFLEEYQQLTRNLHLENKVKFLGNLHPDDLRKITEKADVGLSIEENKGLSYYYSLPNKISDYIQARVPVVVSKFPEMQKIVENYHVGEFITSHEPKHLAEKVKTVLEKGRSSYLPQLEIAAQELCWENEEPKLLELFDRVAPQHRQFKFTKSSL
jgi:glycosyltransferase involved in cell wall biosynthesis